MSITYRYHRDTRDGKIYNCVLMPDGKWWSAENLAWEGAAWIPPQNDGYWDSALAAARLYQLSSVLGNLPTGTHLPSLAEWVAMATAANARSKAAPLKSLAGWDPRYSGANGTDQYGFALIGSNCMVSIGEWVSQTGYGGYLHASDGFVFTYGNTGIREGYNSDDSWMAVRFIVDVFNEPIPPTKIKGMFSGSGVKVFCTNYNTATFELPISAQTTTELTVAKDFIATWGAALGNVRILVVDGEHISEWKDWNFNA